MAQPYTIASALPGDNNTLLVLDFAPDGQGNQVLMLNVQNGSKSQVFTVDRQGHIWNDAPGGRLYLTRNAIPDDLSAVLLQSLRSVDDPNQIWNFKAGPVRVPEPDGKYTLIVSSDEAQSGILQATGANQSVTLQKRNPDQQPPGQSWYDAAHAGRRRPLTTCPRCGGQGRVLAGRRRG